MDFGPSSSGFTRPSPAPAGVPLAGAPVEGGRGDDATGFLLKRLGGETEGVLVEAAAKAAMEAGGATDVASKRLRSAIEGAAAALEEAFIKLGPTHCLMWSTKRCIRILSPHFSHAMRPAGSLGFI